MKLRNCAPNVDDHKSTLSDAQTAFIQRNLLPFARIAESAPVEDSNLPLAMLIRSIYLVHQTKMLLSKKKLPTCS